MRNWLKSKIANIYEITGCNARRRHALLPTVIILTYHGIIPAELIRGGKQLFEYRNVVTQEEFTRQMAHVVRYYQPISAYDLDQLKDPPKGKPYIIITFDDGFENNYRFAFPVLKQMGITGHFFLTTDFMGSRRLLWTEEVTYRIMNTRQKQITLKLDQHQIKLFTGSIFHKERSSIHLRKWLKLQSRKTIEMAMAQLKASTQDVSVDALPRERYQFMSWEQIEEMSQQGMVFGSHTSHHFLLNNLTGEEVKETLQQSREAIERHIHQSCDLFSYPNGLVENFSQRDQLILKNLKFRYAFTQIRGFNPIQQLSQLRFRLHRINISYFMQLPIFKAVITGLWKR